MLEELLLIKYLCTHLTSIVGEPQPNQIFWHTLIRRFTVDLHFCVYTFSIFVLSGVDRYCECYFLCGMVERYRTVPSSTRGGRYDKLYA